jgi:L-alanine-DL-glutamate epimerase-like enolase superfamily enzyme
MKISRAWARLVSLGLNEPYTIAYATIGQVENVFLCLETDTGLRGFGCAAPDPMVTNETAPNTFALVEQRIEPALLGLDPLRITMILDKLQPSLKQHPSALAMVDMALHDLLGKSAGLPLYKLLGGFRKSMLTSITIGILPVVETVDLAERHVRQGFKALKIKGGMDVDLDIERIKKLRERLGKKIRLRFDANQGYTTQEALRFVRGVDTEDVELFEQPTVRHDFQQLGHVSRESTIPVMADESLMNIRDVFRLAKNEWVDMVNIKLMKTGGIDKALQINAVARSAGINAMVGCMDESALAISAGLQFAISRPNITHADLDGHLDLLEDPACGAVLLKRGMLFPTGLPGLGFDPLID